MRLMLVFAPLLPWRVKRRLYSWLYGWQLDPTAYIGLSLVLANHVKMEPNSRIGHLNVFKDITILSLGNHSRIGQWNWFTSARSFWSQDRYEIGTAIIGDHSAVTLRHYVDCSGGVSIGAYTTLAGVRSTLLTHFVDTETNTQTCDPINIGEYCFVGSNVKITPGSSLPDRSVVGMGAVVAGKLKEAGMLYVGVPAKPRAPVDHGAYFSRTIGRVQ